MTDNKLDQMALVSEALYLEEFRKAREILAREAELRDALTQLKARRAQSSGPDMQAIGADILWQGWLDGTVRRLNMELAQVMARKLPVMDRLGKTFGRKEAVRQLARQDAAARKRRRERGQQ